MKNYLLFIQSEKGFFIGHEPAGFGGVEGPPEWDKSPSRARGLIITESNLSFLVPVIQEQCKFRVWPLRLTEEEAAVMEVLYS